MKLPRDISGEGLASALQHLGYSVTRQSGSHLRLTTIVGGRHHVTVPRHNPIRVGTLAAILGQVGDHHGLDRADLLDRLFP